MSLCKMQPLTPEVAALLTLAMFPDPARIQLALDRYASDPAWQVWAWMQGGEPVCAAGLRAEGQRAELLHIGTLPDVRGQGTGRALLLALMQELRLKRLEAETDVSAVGFYRRCNFEASEVETAWGIRFRCVLSNF